MSDFKKVLVDYMLSEKFFDRKKLKIEDVEEKYINMINLINDNAPVKIIANNCRIF